VKVFLDFLAAIGWFIPAGIITLLTMIYFFRKFDRMERFVILAVFPYLMTDWLTAWSTFNRINNHWMFNVMLLPQFTLVIFCMAFSSSNDRLRKIIFTGWLFLAIFHIANIAWIQDINQFANFSYIPASAWMAISSYLYLRDHIEQIHVRPFDHLVSWFALATLIDNAGAIPIVTLLGWNTFIEMEMAYNLWNVIIILYTFWYLIILFGVIWTRTTLRSAFSSSS
jgi:hypothetical protein